MARGISPETIYKELCSQQVDLVFTAHPTQARPKHPRTTIISSAYED